MKKIIIAIDGYSSCGKSSTAKGVAAKMNYAYIDTGAMYRAVTLYFHEHHVSIDSKKEVSNALEDIQIEFRRNQSGKNETYLNGLCVEEEIRKLYIADKVSEVSAIPDVRHLLVAQQRKMGKRKGIVMDGRDIGSVVFPEAELKIFMTAQAQIRAQRRQEELLQKGEMMSFDEVLANIEKRDLIDTTRKESPLMRVEDAQVIDTSDTTLEEQIDMVCAMAEQVISELNL